MTPSVIGRPKTRAADRTGFPPRRALGVETLEDRTVPSTFTVLNLADAGGGLLRQTVLDATARPEADTTRIADRLSDLGHDRHLTANWTRAAVANPPG